MFAYDYDAETEEISNKFVFYRVDEAEGVPDRHTLDKEGFLWQAIYGAGKVVRMSPEGSVVLVLRALLLRARICSSLPRKNETPTGFRSR